MVAKTRHASRPSSLKYLVWALQCLGLHCFKSPTTAAAADAVEISLPLLLWAIFVRTFQIIQIVTDASRSHLSYTGDVGALAEELTGALTTAVAILGQSTLFIKGPVLNQILSECEEEPSPSKRKQVGFSAKIFSTERIMTLLFYCSSVVGVYLNFSFLPFVPGYFKFEMTIYMVHTTAVLFGTMVTAALFREVLSIASRKLDADLDERVLQAGAEGLTQRLHVLERTIRKVELLRRMTVDYFMFVVSTLMCSSTFWIIVNLYCAIRSLTGEYVGIVSPFMRIMYFLISSTTLFHLCYSTHHFSQQVQRVSSQLRDLRVVAPGEENKAQLHYLIWTLESMETFDMGSWYHLNPNTLVSVTTFVLTYLVVLLQVGSYKTQGEPSA